MSRERLYQVMRLMLWIDVVILIAAPWLLRATPPENRGSQLVCLWLIGLSATGMAMLLRARPPPRG